MRKQGTSKDRAAQKARQTHKRTWWNKWLRGLSFKDFAKRVGKEMSNDNVSDNAALLSYYFLFALFPFLFALVAFAAYLPIHEDVQILINKLGTIMPKESFGLISTQLSNLVNNQKPHLLTIGAISSLWTASRAVDAFRKSLNLAYDVKESRSALKTNALALGMTVAGAVLILLSVAIMAVGGKLGFFIVGKLHIGKAAAFAAMWLRWPIAAAVVMLVVALVYYVLPDVKQKFKYLTPGSVLATVMWLVATWGFTQYVEHFGSYNVYYGSIGSVIVLMMWLYYTGLIFILGGEINAVLEFASTEGKEPGAREFGEEAPPAITRPSFSPPGAANSREVAARAPNGKVPPPPRPHGRLRISPAAVAVVLLSWFRTKRRATV